ncbi:MAG: GntR family transcriptional regulator [Candidatus Competibacterales bacterium]
MARATTTPLYRRVYETLLERVIAGRWRPGTLLPSEIALGRELGVSQGTARKALMLLEEAGVVERRQGRGTFVATTTPERALFHFFRLRRADGRRVAPTLVTEHLTRRSPSPEEQTAFGAVAREGVFDLHRVRSVEGVPVVRERIVVPAVRFPELDGHGPLPNTLYALYQGHYGIAIVQAEEALTAVAADPADTAALGVAPGTPLLQVARWALDLSEQLVELRLSRYALGDELHYGVTLR